MIIDKIEKGIVIDHIKPGRSMEIYNFLKLDKVDFTVAIIKNAKSKSGKKDLLKIENTIDFDMEVLGFLDPDITINIIENGVITKKTKLSLPKRVDNIVKCVNPRCITSIEQELTHSFKLVDEDTRTYRCIYCEASAKDNR